MAAKSPDRRCLCYEGEWLSYGEVAARVSAGAARLAALGVGPGVVVGVMLDRSFDLVVSILCCAECWRVLPALRPLLP